MQFKSSLSLKSHTDVVNLGNMLIMLAFIPLRSRCISVAIGKWQCVCRQLDKNCVTEKASQVITSDLQSVRTNTFLSKNTGCNFIGFIFTSIVNKEVNIIHLKK